MKNCEHLKQAHDVAVRERVCEDCIRTGDRWVHLRVCLYCGHVGCCDSSPNGHATKHFQETQHAIIRSIEPGENWGWCYVDKIMYDFSQGLEKARVAE